MLCIPKWWSETNCDVEARGCKSKEVTAEQSEVQIRIRNQEKLPFIPSRFCCSFLFFLSFIICVRCQVFCAIHRGTRDWENSLLLIADCSIIIEWSKRPNAFRMSPQRSVRPYRAASARRHPHIRWIVHKWRTQLQQIIFIWFAPASQCGGYHSFVRPIRFFSNGSSLFVLQFFYFLISDLS